MSNTPMAMTIPMVIERGSHGERVYDLYSRMLESRVIFLTGGIDDHVAQLIISQFLWLESVNPGAEIKFYINSPGGSVSAGLAIYDTINSISSPVITYGLGNCASMGCVLLSAKYDRAGCKRIILPSARVMAHQVSGGAGGQCEDIRITAKLMADVNEKLLRKIAQFTGQTYEKIKNDAKRDYWMTAEEAVEQGYADEILQAG